MKIDQLLRMCNEADLNRARAETERDAAVARADDLDQRLAKVMFDYQDLEDERDAAVARAKQAEWERDQTVDACALYQRDMYKWKSRAERAERELEELRSKVNAWGRERTAPTVTRAEVWRVVVAHDPGDDEMALRRVNRLTDAVCDLFGVEAEAVVDPVEKKARELAAAGGIDFDEQEPDGVEMLLGMARHVLGQEAGDE